MFCISTPESRWCVLFLPGFYMQHFLAILKYMFFWKTMNFVFKIMFCLWILFEPKICTNHAAAEMGTLCKAILRIWHIHDCLWFVSVIPWSMIAKIRNLISLINLIVNPILVINPIVNPILVMLSSAWSWPEWNLRTTFSKSNSANALLSVPGRSGNWPGSTLTSPSIASRHSVRVFWW